METHQVEFAVVGAGASGLMAAGETAQAGSTLVLEAKQRPGKKLLATGNGRCNLGNSGASPAHYHGDVARAARVLERFPPEKLEQFWRRNGMLCRELEEGRLYPYGMQAASVLGCLLRRVQRRGGEILCDFPVEEIRREKGFLALSGPAGKVRARRVILACGGMAAPALGGGIEGGHPQTRGNVCRGGGGHLLHRGEGFQQGGLHPAQIHLPLLDPKLLGHQAAMVPVLPKVPAGLAGKDNPQGVVTGLLAQDAYQGAVLAAGVPIDKALGARLPKGFLQERHPILQFLFIVAHRFFPPYRPADALTNSRNKGWARLGRLLNSGWY